MKGERKKKERKGGRKDGKVKTRKGEMERGTRGE